MDSEWYGNTNIKQRRFMKKILILFLLFTSTICLGQNHWFKVVNTIYNINERVSILILERNDSLFHVVSNIDEQKHPRKRNKNIRYAKKLISSLAPIDPEMKCLNDGDLILVNLKIVYPDSVFNVSGFTGNTEVFWNYNTKISVSKSKSDIFHNALYYAEEIKGQLIPKRCEFTSLRELIYDEEKNGKTAYEIAMLFKVELKIVEEILSQKH